MAWFWNGTNWEDDQTGETASQAYYEQYIAPQVAQQPAPTQSYGGGAVTGAPAGGGTGLNIPQGYQYEIQAREHAVQKYISELEASTARDIANINNQAAAELARADRELQLRLQRNEIDAQKYMQMRELKQRESEFARDLALRTLIAERDYELGQAELELGRLAEVRMERELQAKLAANPQDFVAYEMYKRLRAGQTVSATDPELMEAQNQQSWDAASLAAQGNELLGTEQGDTTLIGQPYDAPPPAYTDETLQQVAQGIQQQAEAAWNPALSGKGVFGSTINAPNMLSRQQANNMSESEMGILTSFLRAGIETEPGGPRMALDPQEWFTQAEKSWIPTLESVGGLTRYS